MDVGFGPTARLETRCAHLPWYRPRSAARALHGGGRDRHGDRARAAICDLLEVTRQVMKPPSENGTHWCAEVAPKRMVEWCLSELAEVEEEIERAEKAELAAKRRTSSPDASALRATPSRRRRKGVIEGRRTEDALFITPEKRESEPSETDADATTPAQKKTKAGGAEARVGVPPGARTASTFTRTEPIRLSPRRASGARARESRTSSATCCSTC